MTQEHSSKLSFSIEESVWLNKDEEIEAILGMSLEPEIVIEERDQYVYIKGGLRLVGEYKATDEEGSKAMIDKDSNGDQVPFRTPVDATFPINGHGEIKHFFPIDITIPLERIHNLNDVYVQIDSFDYDLPEKSCIQLTADISISGMVEKDQIKKLNTKVETTSKLDAVPTTFSFEAKRQPVLEDALDVNNGLGTKWMMEGSIPSNHNKENSQQKGTPIAEEVSVEARTPIVEEVSVEARTPIAEEVSVEARTPIAEEVSVEEGTPIVEEVSVEEGTPIGEEVSVEEGTPISEKVPVIAEIQAVEGSLTEQTNKPVNEEQVEKTRQVDEEVLLTNEEKDLLIEELDEEVINEEVRQETEETMIEEQPVEKLQPKQEPKINLVSLTEEMAELRSTTDQEKNGEPVERHPTHQEENALYLTKMMSKEEERFTKLRMCIIQEDESLETIANRYEVSANQLVRMNRLQQDQVVKGQILYIPVIAES